MIQNFEYHNFEYNNYDDNYQFIYYYEKDDYLYSVETTRFYKQFEEKYSAYEISKSSTQYIDWSTTKIIYKLETIINGFVYVFYKSNNYHAIEGSKLSLKNKTDEDKAPNIICPICRNDSFTIQYGSYIVYAKCNCGNFMEIYSG